MLRLYIKCFVVGLILSYIISFAASCLTAHGSVAQFDPYAVLGIDRGSNFTDVKRAYRRLALMYHPEKRHGSEELFAKVHMAWEVLKADERCRDDYTQAICWAKLPRETCMDVWQRWKICSALWLWPGTPAEHEAPRFAKSRELCA